MLRRAGTLAWTGLVKRGSRGRRRFVPVSQLSQLQVMSALLRGEHLFNAIYLPVPSYASEAQRWTSRSGQSDDRSPLRGASQGRCVRSPALSYNIAISSSWANASLFIQQGHSEHVSRRLRRLCRASPDSFEILHSVPQLQKPWRRSYGEFHKSLRECSPSAS